jgi:hypothetical protein
LLDVGQKNHLTNKDTKHSQQEDFVDKIEDVTGFASVERLPCSKKLYSFATNLLKDTDRGKNHVQKE